MSLLTVKGQHYALVSIVESKDDRPHIFTILGTFPSIEDAKVFAKQVSEDNNQFNVFLCELGKWNPVPATEEYVENVEYQDQYVQELMKGYEKNQVEAKKHFEERKRELLNKNVETPSQDEITQ